MGARPAREKSLIGPLRTLWTERLRREGQLALPGDAGPHASAVRIFELSSAILSLERRRVGRSVEATCFVSLIVGDHRGSILMMSSGGATVSEPYRPGGEKGVASSALAAAVETAHRNLKEFLRRR